jgi:hypothetical protein
MAKQIIPIRSSTQKFTEIADIDNDIVMFSDGSCAMIITTTAVNFGLLSDKEQEAIIYAYAGLLNSLSFPIQILIRTQHKDIGSYLELLKTQERKETNPKLKTSIASYRAFVEKTVKEKDVLDKKFYFVIPFSYIELGVSTKILFGGKRGALPYPKERIYERALTVLTPKKDHIIRLLTRLGLRSSQLTNDQLTRLFFTVYNHGSPLPQTIEPASQTEQVMNQQIKKPSL